MPKAPKATPIRPSQPPKQTTSTQRNRCLLDDVAQREGIQVNHVRSLSPALVKEIVAKHWTVPLWIPLKFPGTYPPVPPLLDQPLEDGMARDLRQAFTQNNVTYSTAGIPGNLILELFGDKHMASLLAEIIEADLDRLGERSIYNGLDLGGMDVSYIAKTHFFDILTVTHLQIVFRQICCGVQQSFFAMMYNFPARITLAYKESPYHHRQLFSQRDMEGTFEAYLTVCRKHVENKELLRFFRDLITPWIPGTVEAARKFQRERDGEEGIGSALASTNKKRHALLERRPAPARFVGKLSFVMNPTIKVRTKTLIARFR
jgi:hypothetical protein